MGTEQKSCGARKGDERCVFPVRHKGAHSWDHRLKVRWTLLAMQEAAQRWNEEYGEPPRYIDWVAGAKGTGRYVRDKVPSTQTVVARFGSWSEFLRSAGLSSETDCSNPHCHRKTVRPSDARLGSHLGECSRCTTYRQWSEEQWMPVGMRRAVRRAHLREKSREALRAFVAEEGYVPNSRQWIRSGRRPVFNTIRKAYGGSWGAAIRDADL